jgi:hypothetical protein
VSNDVEPQQKGVVSMKFSILFYEL